MNTLKKLIIIPAYNEEINIANTTNALKAYPQYDYVVINDGSVDGTEEILLKDNIPHIQLIKNLGIGGAMQTGYKYAMENGYDIAIQLDADGQHNPAYLDDITNTLTTSGCDMVIGSRYINKEGFQSSITRRIGKTILTALIKLFTGKTVTDPTSGFRGCNRKVIMQFASAYPVDYPEPDTIVSLLAGKHSITEIPVIMEERAGGTSSITFFKSVYYMIKVSISIVFSYFSNKKKRKKK